VIPANTFVTVNGQALHCDRQTWGEDAAVWRPDRWIRTSKAGEEELIEPAEGSYVPWASGPRVCPGKRFAQVEFVAAMSYLFRDHRVRPVVPGSTPQVARERALAMVEDCAINAITLQMRNPRVVRMAWRPSGK
jgi:cytochrome P450